jgi:hypothetical protein
MSGLVAIDDKPASRWTEDDLQSLCDERRLEGPRLEFKRQLDLHTDRQKAETRRDSIGMANAGPGPGYIIYGIDEADVGDGSTAASTLMPLTDGALIERLNNVLDGGGQPPLIFELHRIPAPVGGYFLVVELYGRRRPHQAADGTYPVRRNLLVRKMTEAEVAESYRERFRREHLGEGTAGRATQREGPLDEARARIHRGLQPAELALRAEERGDTSNPGWFSVLVMPDPPHPGLFDPTQVSDETIRAISVPEVWNSEHPLAHFFLQRSLDGLHAQLPPRDDVTPAYLLHFWPDGVMEFGADLEPSLLHGDARDRMIPTLSIADYAHDYSLLFIGALEARGYMGRVAMQYALDDVAQHTLGVDRARVMPRELPPLGRRTVEGPLWTGDLSEARSAVGPLVKRLMDRLFLAGGLSNGCYFLDADGNKLSR